MLTTAVITLLVSFSICTGHEVFNAEELLHKVVEILEYLVKEKQADQGYQHDKEIFAKLDRTELRLDQLENATAVRPPSPTCAPCSNKTCRHCPDRWIQFQGSCYLFVNNTINFAQARAYCHSVDAHLVYVESENENEFLQSQLNNLKAFHYWIGLTDANTEGVFKYTGSDDLVSFTDWYPGQPNNHRGNENCAHFGHTFNYKWQDGDCANLKKSICEKTT